MVRLGPRLAESRRLGGSSTSAGGVVAAKPTEAYRNGKGPCLATTAGLVGTLIAGIAKTPKAPNSHSTT